MKTFISYARDRKEIAGEIKEYLDDFGFSCFLAHEDIPPQSKWPKELQNALEECDLFMPIISPGFIESYYCQQETGFACCRKIEILSVSMSKDPIGMIADSQAIKFNKNKFESSCWKIVSHIAKNRRLKRPVLDALIEWFSKCNHYVESTKRAKMILNEFKYSPRQVRLIKRHIKGNNQIYNNKNARDYILPFMRKHDEIFDKDFVSWYDSKEASRMFMYY